MSRDGQPSEELVSNGDLTVLSPHKEPRRQFTRKEKGKKKMSDYDFISAELDCSESDVEPLQKRSKSAEKAVKSANHELCRSIR